MARLGRARLSPDGQPDRVLCLWRDKSLAVRNRRRIPEATLLRWAALGGAGGALCAMLVCRHKTRKPKFFILVPLLAALQTAALVLLILFAGSL